MLSTEKKHQIYAAALRQWRFPPAGGVSTDVVRQLFGQMKADLERVGATDEDTHSFVNSIEHAINRASARLHGAVSAKREADVKENLEAIRDILRSVFNGSSQSTTLKSVEGTVLDEIRFDG